MLLFTIERLTLAQPDGTGIGRFLATFNLVVNRALVMPSLRLVMFDKGPGVAMPSRKLRIPCGECGRSHEFDAKFCPHCGTHLPFYAAPAGQPTHTDIIQAIDGDVRDRIEAAALAAFGRAVEGKRAVEAARWRAAELVANEDRKPEPEPMEV